MMMRSASSTAPSSSSSSRVMKLRRGGNGKASLWTTTDGSVRGGGSSHARGESCVVGARGRGVPRRHQHQAQAPPPPQQPQQQQHQYQQERGTYASTAYDYAYLAADEYVNVAELDYAAFEGLDEDGVDGYGHLFDVEEEDNEEEEEEEQEEGDEDNGEFEVKNRVKGRENQCNQSYYDGEGAWFNACRNEYSFDTYTAQRVRKIRNGRLVSDETRSVTETRQLLESVNEAADEHVVRQNALGQGAARVVAMSDEDVLRKLNLDHKSASLRAKTEMVLSVLTKLRCPMNALKLFRTLQGRNDWKIITCDARVYATLIARMTKLASRGDVEATEEVKALVNDLLTVDMEKAKRGPARYLMHCMTSLIGSFRNFQGRDQSRPGSHASRGQWQSAQAVFDGLVRVGLRPDRHVYSALIGVLGSCGEWKRALDVYRQMEDDEVEADVVVYADLIYACGKARRYREAVSLFRLMKAKGLTPDNVIYTAIVHALASCGRTKHALDVWKNMKSEGMSPNSRTYTCLLKACTHDGDTENAKLVLDSMKEENVSMNAHHYNQIIKLYIDGDRFNESFSILDMMQKNDVQPSVVTFNTLISGCAKRRDLPTARRLLDEMSLHNVKPDVFTYTPLIFACAEVGEIDHAKEVFERMIHAGVEPDIRTYNVLTMALVRGNRLSEAEALIDSIRARGEKVNNVTYNTIIQGFRSAKEHDQVNLYYRRMIDDGIAADSYTYTQLILSCGDTSDWRGGIAHFHTMLNKSVDPNPFVCSALWRACQGFHSESWTALEEIEDRCFKIGFNFTELRTTRMNNTKKNRRRMKR